MSDLRVAHGSEFVENPALAALSATTLLCDRFEQFERIGLCREVHHSEDDLRRRERLQPPIFSLSGLP